MQDTEMLDILNLNSEFKKIKIKYDLKDKGQHPSVREGSENALVFGIMGDSGQFESPADEFWQADNPL